MTIWGPSIASISPSPGSYLINSPPTDQGKKNDKYERDEIRDPIVKWCRNCENVLDREKQPITLAMQKAMSLYRGGTPWWTDRPTWKMGTRLQEPFFVTTQWAAILSDNKPQVTYSAVDPSKQRQADIATAAFRYYYNTLGWQLVEYQATLLSRIQKKGFLRLTFDERANGGAGGPSLIQVSGEQIAVNKGARNIMDAEVVKYTTRLSYGEICIRYPGIKEALDDKGYENRRYEEQQKGGEVSSPPTSMSFPTDATASPPFSPGGSTAYNPPYSASSNAPDGVKGTDGYKVVEFWTKSHKTIDVWEPGFSVSGEPETRPKEIEYEDGTTEPMRRVWTEGMVVYEVPESVLDLLNRAAFIGGPQVLNDLPAYEVVERKSIYPLYPEGRLTTIIDNTIKADDRMNPLGYVPFIEIQAYPDGVDFWGLSDIDIIADPYEYEVRLASSLLDAAHMTSNPLWRMPIGSELSDDDITNAPGAIQREDLASLRYGKREPGPDMPAYVMQLLSYMDAKIQKLSGLNDIAMGSSKGKAQQSTDSLTMQQEAAGVRFRAAMHNLELANQMLGWQFLQLMKRFFRTPQLIQIRNMNGSIEAVSFLGTHFDEPLRVESKPGSAQPSPTARLNMLLNLLDKPKPIVDLTEVWQALQEMGVIASASALERRIVQEMHDPLNSWRVSMPMPGNQKQSKKPDSKRGRSGVAA